ncbi:MAG: stage II sporulation protein M [Halolamina sp.]
MSPSDALRAAVTLPVDRPTDVLPAFVLAAAAPSAARVPLYAAVTGALWLLSRAGLLDPVVAQLREVDWQALSEAGGPGPGPGAGVGGAEQPPAGVDGLGPALADLAQPTVVALLAVGAGLAVVVYLLARSVAAAATQATTLAALGGHEDPLSAGVVGVGRYWRAFLGVTLVRLLGFGAAAVPAAVGVAAFSAIGPVGAVLALAGGLLSLALVVGVAVALTFAGPAVVVDDVGATSAVGNSVGFVRREPAAAAVYLVVTVGLSVGVGVLSTLAGAANVQRLVALATLLVVGPVLTGFSLALYGGLGPASRRETTAEPTTPRPSVRRRLRAGAATGLRSLGAFVRGHPGANLLSAGLLAGGAAAGYLSTARYGVAVAPDRGIETFGLVPVGPFLNIAANNWLVAAGGAFGGVFGAVPAAATVLFNGAIVGAVAGVFEPTHFLALVAPHGVVELPAIAVAGGLGLHLGVVGVRTARGRLGVGVAAAELRRAWRVLVGLAVVIAVAAAIEAFLTPMVAELVL